MLARAGLLAAVLCSAEVSVTRSHARDTNDMIDLG